MKLTETMQDGKITLFGDTMDLNDALSKIGLSK